MEALIEPQGYGQPNIAPIEPLNAPNATVPATVPCRVILVILAVVTVLCIFIGAAVVVTVAGSFVTEGPRIEQVLDGFMKAGANRDAVAIRSLIASRALQGKRPWGVDEMIKGNNYALFQGYLDLSLTEMQFTY
jgi:hypothetical protein